MDAQSQRSSALFETPSRSFAQVGGRHKKRIRGEAEKHVTGDELDAWVKQGASIVLSHFDIVRSVWDSSPLTYFVMLRYERILRQRFTKLNGVAPLTQHSDR